MLHFEPVLRKCVRHDGWLHERQREFIIALTVLGHAEQAAIAVGGTMSGAYKLRSANGGEGFADSWDAALALHLRRNPRPEPKGRPSRGELRSGTGRKPWPDAPATPPEGWVDPKVHYLSAKEFGEKILKRYWMKLRQEREARLAGRIVEADYIVRQLSRLEIALDLGGNAVDLLVQLKRRNLELNRIAATPMSVLLESLRRKHWKEQGEPERPPSPPLGEHDDTVATGEPPHWLYRHDRDGDENEWRRREGEKAALNAEAQRAWVGGKGAGGSGGMGEAPGGRGRRRP